MSKSIGVAGCSNNIYFHWYHLIIKSIETIVYRFMSSTSFPLNRIFILGIISLAFSHNDFPSCTSPSTYTNYTWSTSPKGLRQSVGWDRTLRERCKLSEVPVNTSCGDCDADMLKSKTWYRFSEPKPCIAEVSISDPNSAGCPETGYCNGYRQILLSKPADFNTGHIDSTYHRIVLSTNGKCSILGRNAPDEFVKALKCGSFYLYRFPEILQTNISCSMDIGDDPDKHADTSAWQPYSLCMVDSSENFYMLWTLYIVLGVVLVLVALCSVLAFFFHKQRSNKKCVSRYAAQLSVEHVTFSRQSTHLYDDLSSMGVNMPQPIAGSHLVIPNTLAIEHVLKQLVDREDGLMADGEAKTGDIVKDCTSGTPDPLSDHRYSSEDPEESYTQEADAPCTYIELTVANVVYEQVLANVQTNSQSIEGSYISPTQCVIHKLSEPSQPEDGMPQPSVSKTAAGSPYKQPGTKGNYSINELVSVGDDTSQVEDDSNEPVTKASSHLHPPKVLQFRRQSTHLYEDLLPVEPSSKRDYIHLIECSGPLSSNGGTPGDYMIPNEVLPYIEDRPTRGRALTDSNLSTLNLVNCVREPVPQNSDKRFSTNFPPSDLTVKIPIESYISECDSCRNDSCCSGLGSPGNLSTPAGPKLNVESCVSTSLVTTSDKANLLNTESIENNIPDLQKNRGSDPLSKLSKADRVRIVDEMNRVSIGGNGGSCDCSCVARKEKAIRLCSV